MKKINKLLLLLLIVPLCISFSSCKKKKNPDNSNQNQIEQPTPPAPDEDTPDYESTKETYSVSFDYNLPEEYDFLLADSDFEINYKEVGTSTTLAKVPDLKLQDYFLGWFEEGTDTILSGSITSDKAKTFKLKGKWDEVALKKYYYSDGINFDIIDGKASITSYTGSDRKIFIPEFYKYEQVDYSVREIQASAFEAKQFDKLIVYASNLNIGEAAFKDSNISEFDFSRVYKIGKNAFENTNFVELDLDGDISSIAQAAFKNCVLLERVDFNDNNIEFASELFKGCVKLENVGNTRYIKHIGTSAFEGCSSLINTDFVGSNVTIIEDYAFKNCTGLISVTLPESLNAIYEGVFEGCDKVSELVLGKTFEDEELENDTLIKRIGNIGKNITKITLTGTSITKLSENFFDGFFSLNTFNMCDSITEIESYAFRDCSNLTNIKLSSNLDVNKLTHLALFGTKFINELSAPWIYKHHVIYVPKNIDSEFEFSASDAVVAIRNGAFSYNTSLQKIKIPSTIKTIGESAFEECTNLVEVEFEENSNITTLAKNLFLGCNKLTTINLSQLTNLSAIEDYAFSGVKISNMVIPSTVTDIGNAVFLNAAISSFSISGTPDKFEAFDGVLYQVGVNEKVLLNYPTLKEGSLFFCPADVTTVAAYAFSNVVNLKYIYFEDVMDWEEITVMGESTNKSFLGSANIRVFAEKPVFISDELSYIYRWVSLNVTYDSINGTVTLEDGFSTDERFLYMTVINQDTQKIDIVYFEVVSSTGQGQEIVYSVRSGSVKVLHTDRTA